MEKNLLNAQNIIGQEELRKLEALCTTEEPPACTAACPLHLDARELCRLVAAGDFAAAFTLYQKAVPFARLVACTCDAPCKGVCKRGDLGGAVEIQRLEQAVSAFEGMPQKPPMMLRKKPGRTAVAGGGLRGMAAANDLARKGYEVTLFEKSDKLGGWLRELPEAQLPAALLEEEIEVLLKLGVKAEYGVEVPLGTPGEAEAFLLDGYDVAFVACESPLDGLVDGESLCVAGREKLLAGRRSGRLSEGASSIHDVYDGRSAAASIDRIFQKVNLMAGREREGSFETTLFTSLGGLEPEAARPPEGPGGYGQEEARREAARCIQCQCLECVKKCGFLQQYKGNPRRYVREVYNNLSITMGSHLANGMINACAICGQCEAICPNGLDLAQVFRAARERMVMTGKMPPSAHEFALLDMEYSLSVDFFTARHQPGRERSEYLFFPGCQLAASEPGLVKAIYGDLCGRLPGGVGLMLACCGVMAHWAGDKGAFEKAKLLVKGAWESLGRPVVVTACPSCTATFNDLLGIPARDLYSLLAELGPIPGMTHNGGSMRLHHACGARHDGETRRRVRALAEMAGVLLGEPDAPGDQDPCCGYGGLAYYANQGVAGRITEVALDQLGEQPVLTYCVNCRDLYLEKGRQARHLLELCYPGAEGLRQRKPTWSERQENRAALKRELLAGFWGEEKEGSPGMELHIDETLRQKLEEAHILESDLAKTIGYAEESGEKFLDPATGRSTGCYRPGNVTFWTEYSPEGAGWRVHNAYCHRMAFVLTDRLSEGGKEERP